MPSKHHRGRQCLGAGRNLNGVLSVQGHIQSSTQKHADHSQSTSLQEVVSKFCDSVGLAWGLLGCRALPSALPDSRDFYRTAASTTTSSCQKLPSGEHVQQTTSAYQTKVFMGASRCDHVNSYAACRVSTRLSPNDTKPLSESMLSSILRDACAWTSTIYSDRLPFRSRIALVLLSALLHARVSAVSAFRVASLHMNERNASSH